MQRVATGENLKYSCQRGAQKKQHSSWCKHGKGQALELESLEGNSRVER